MKSNNVCMENTLTLLLSGFAISIFFTKTGISIFGLAGILFIVIWKYLIKYEQTNYIPRLVFWLTMLFFLDLVLSASLSENSKWAFSELGKYRHILFGGLVFVAPLSNENRKKIIIVFFISAALDASVGILQYFDVLPKAYSRPHGFSSHPILFAADLAFVCGSAVMMLFIKNDIFTTVKEKYLLSTVAVLTVVGIVLSESRGVWIALFAACIAVLFFYKRRKALIFALFLFAIFIPLLSLSGTLRQRAASIVTSFYTEDAKGSTGNRLELLNGALLIFKKHPLLGTGYGDFQADIKELVSENKLQDIPATVHAHNIFFQALATRGIIGFIILIALFISLILWGKQKIECHSVIGGYIIILSALLTIVGGLTENNIEIHRFLAVYCFTIGMIGPYGPEKTANLV